MSMEVDSGSVALPPTEHRPTTAATVLCYNCGAPIDGTQAAGALCNDCLKTTVDITQGIDREGVLLMCRDCDRWLSPPSQWVGATLESRELLALCLRKLRGLNKSRIIDAHFIWTEPHSRRVKLKITVQQEAFQGAILQQDFPVEFVQQYKQCPDCAKSYTHNTWRAVVQVRQKVPHKRTFLYLEQLILKQGAHKDTINIKENPNGIDFFFAQRNHAEKFVDFLTSVSPVRTKKAQELISHDVHTSSTSYKHTYSCELVPICKDDLVALPPKLARQIGSISPLVLCYRVGTAINLLDPNTLQIADLNTAIYWRSPFSPIADVQELVEFIVMDIEPTGPENGRFVLADVTIVRASDLGVNDTEYLVRTHLGAVLHAGDSVMGYHLTGTQFNNENFEEIENSKQYAGTIPDVILVKKHYPARKKGKSRNWRLKRITKEESAEQRGRKGAGDADRDEVDYEQFLRDIEADEELRQGMNMYRNPQHGAKNVAQDAAMETDGEEDDGLEIPMDQLIDEMDDINLEDHEEV
ncbi:nonsense-mediated mRNA decay protein 3 [Neohortaea acidophila]|uniref:60S ribosomal export protein NMD3 n=1 Tax=Neohortaea acidophila TaxID=245834 RepID=A0A6A6PRY5_9PEZI|nr:nonsense-mediated mRNA decay protein 3 [Neohortaea acidophila]KAF2482888.1 nonsense-mediated mRNA decay protein 3 [Neohortaea acidophila]